jgi:PPM family protein phosphatase
MTFTLHFSGRSDRGRVRPRNEDTFHLEADTGLAVVADGMGGHPAGAEASRLAVRTFLTLVAESANMLTSSGAWGERMVEAVEEAHRCLLDEGDRDPARAGMGTTLTALHVDPATGRGELVHIGDSRAYRMRDGQLTRLSRDHTWVQEQVEAGVLDASLARVHPMAHVLTRVLGGVRAAPAPQLRTLDGRGGDLYLLCTDGLTAHLSDEDLGEILSAAPDPAAAAGALVDAANERGGSDNITVALVGVEGNGTRPA